jgi:hypothetical protein
MAFDELNKKFTVPLLAVQMSRAENINLGTEPGRRVIWRRDDSAGIHGTDASIAGSLPNDSQRKLSMLQCVMRCSSEFVGPEDFVICAGYDVLCNGTYRAWSEVKKDGQRVERSGLIGPRFVDADAAEQYALAWGRQWLADLGLQGVSCSELMQTSEV